MSYYRFTTQKTSEGVEVGMNFLLTPDEIELLILYQEKRSLNTSPEHREKVNSPANKLLQEKNLVKHDEPISDAWFVYRLTSLGEEVTRAIVVEENIPPSS